MTAAAPAWIVSGFLIAIAPLSERHRAWLEEQVPFIITDRERSAFEELETDEERDRFIVAFWEARDPTPGTGRNELRDEHEKRLREARQLFRGHGRPGERTERGRIYIQLGPPRERRAFDGQAELFPIEVWFYQTSDPSLPSAFYLLFYRPGGAGDYRLWDPVGEGPAALLATGTGNPLFYDRGRALDVLRSADEDLFLAVVAPIPGEPAGASAAFSHQRLLATLEDFPDRTLAPASRDRYQPGRGIVASDFIFRRLNVHPLLAVLPAPDGPFLHYSLDVHPEELAYAQYRDTFYTVFDVAMEIVTLDETPVHRIDNRHEIELTRSGFDAARNHPVSLQGRVPIIAGDFRVDVLIRNRTARVFDRLQFPLSVPRNLSSSALLPARAFKAVANDEAELAFQIGGTLAVPHPESIYRPGESLRAFVVLAPFESGSGSRVEVRGRIVQEEREIHRFDFDAERSPRRASDLVAVSVALGDIPEGSYRLELTQGSEKTEMSFEVTDSPAALPPLVNSAPELPASHGTWSAARAEQHLAVGETKEALAALEAAVTANPELEEVRLRLGVLALALDEPQRALDGIVPGIMRAPFHAELLSLAGYAAERLGRLSEAARYYERVRSGRRADAKLLDALARVYDALDEPEKARAVREERERHH